MKLSSVFYEICFPLSYAVWQLPYHRLTLSLFALCISLSDCISVFLCEEWSNLLAFIFPIKENEFIIEDTYQLLMKNTLAASCPVSLFLFLVYWFLDSISGICPSLLPLTTFFSSKWYLEIEVCQPEIMCVEGLHQSLLDMLKVDLASAVS